MASSFLFTVWILRDNFIHVLDFLNSRIWFLFWVLLRAFFKKFIFLTFHWFHPYHVLRLIYCIPFISMFTFRYLWKHPLVFLWWFLSLNYTSIFGGVKTPSVKVQRSKCGVIVQGGTQIGHGKSCFSTAEGSDHDCQHNHYFAFSLCPRSMALY